MMINIIVKLLILFLKCYKAKLRWRKKMKINNQNKKIVRMRDKMLWRIRSTFIIICGWVIK